MDYFIYYSTIYGYYELTPIFFKMMLIKSPYDFMNDNIKSLIRAEQGIEVKYEFIKTKKVYKEI